MPRRCDALRLPARVCFVRQLSLQSAPGHRDRLTLASSVNTLSSAHENTGVSITAAGTLRTEKQRLTAGSPLRSSGFQPCGARPLRSSQLAFVASHSSPVSRERAQLIKTNSTCARRAGPSGICSLRFAHRLPFTVIRHFSARFLFSLFRVSRRLHLSRMFS